ncbi:MAG: hypothetical protein ABIT07_01430 [Ferruginibacter sp.]
MKKILFSFFVLAVATGCGPSIYKAQDFDDRTASHKIVAIVPAEVSISLRPNEMKKTTVEQLQQSEENTGRTIQDKMYSWFLRRSEKFKYTVAFQDVSKTNAILLKNGITYTGMRAKTKEELAQLLGVDAIISSKVSMKKPMSDGAAVALSLLLGSGGSTNDVQISIGINEAKKGDLVWKYDFTAAGSVGSNTDNLVNALMRNASKKFPYNDK